ncbi:MAG: nucleotidyltransferase [Halobacteriovoraceae bacterium]|jgi:nucleotidyltransferase substrate binding protein (TIGR01987 family)|nr:nucleotidyltransferase [Halobacteriovoraceae bacterium]
MSKIHFQALNDALNTFEQAMLSPPKSELERDGVIQRFEYTFELCWKSIRKLLLELGRQDVSSSPKPLFRDAHQENLIGNIDTWFKYIDARNRTSHTYNQKTAEQVYDDIKAFGLDARALLEKLNDKLKDC